MFWLQTVHFDSKNSTLCLQFSALLRRLHNTRVRVVLDYGALRQNVNPTKNDPILKTWNSTSNTQKICTDSVHVTPNIDIDVNKNIEIT